MIQTETIVGMMNNRKKNMYGIYTCEMGQYHDSKRYMLHACFVEQEAAKEYACFLRRKGFFSHEDIIVMEVSTSFPEMNVGKPLLVIAVTGEFLPVDESNFC